MVAERVYQQGRKLIVHKYNYPLCLRCPDILESSEISVPLHVWVLGNGNWLDSDLPATIKSICGHENDPSYRILIIGRDLTAIKQRPYFDNWGDWTYAAGMKHRKKHKDKQKTQTAALSILKPLAEYYNRRKKASTQILLQLAVPVEYIGD